MAAACSEYAIVVTRALSQSDEFRDVLAQRGFKVIAFPAIEIRTMPLDSEFRAANEAMRGAEYEWVVFSSTNGVKSFAALQGRACIGAGIKVAVVGETTGAVFSSLFGRNWDLKPEQYDAESLLVAFQRFEVKGRKILLIRAKKGREVLAVGLKERGAIVQELGVYETVTATPDLAARTELLNAPAENLIFTFFSPSAVHGTLGLLGDDLSLLQSAKIASIGAVTSAAIRSLGLEPWVESREASAEVLVESICTAIKGQGIP